MNPEILTEAILMSDTTASWQQPDEDKLRISKIPLSIKFYEVDVDQIAELKASGVWKGSACEFYREAVHDALVSGYSNSLNGSARAAKILLLLNKEERHREILAQATDKVWDEYYDAIRSENEPREQQTVEWARELNNDPFLTTTQGKKLSQIINGKLKQRMKEQSA